MISLKHAEKTGPPDESEPKEEELTAAHTPNRPEVLEPGGTGSLGVLAIMQRWLPPAPPGFTGQLAVMPGPPPLEDVD